MAFEGNTPVIANNVTATGDNVDFIRNDLSANFDKYNLIHDALKGDDVVKAAGVKYLPMPNATDQSPANIARYAAYKTRAVFYGVTKRTLAGYIGQVFNVPPTVKVPKDLDAVVKDANGSGVPLAQLAQEVETDVIGYGRSGLFIDFPRTNGKAITKADQESGRIRPTIINFAPWNIINWRTEKINGDTVLTLIVLRERFEEKLGKFGLNTTTQYRVLELRPTVDDPAILPEDQTYTYWQSLYRETNKQLLIVPSSEIQPVDHTGKPLNYIPFTFVGAVNNDVRIDDAPLYDLASLNMAHYRNSADYEDSTFMIGQPTPVVTGVTKQWIDDVFKGEIHLGSRAVVPLPVGADFKIEQTEGNSQCYEAMQAKERQMVALGAKLVEQSQVQRTATEAGLESASEVSILATITGNVSAAFKFALEVCSLFTGSVSQVSDANNETLVFTLNTEFALADATPEEINTAVKAWQMDAITWEEMRAKLRRTGLATVEDKKAKQDIADEMMADAENNDVLGLGPTGEPLPEPKPKTAAK